MYVRFVCVVIYGMCVCVCVCMYVCSSYIKHLLLKHNKHLTYSLTYK